MHASLELAATDFDVAIDSMESDVSALFPGWQLEDRLGVVVHEPFGSLGASLAIQSAVALFYAALPARRHSSAQYPPLFLFHVGGRHGDHSPMDCWPPRREVFLGPEPYQVLGAINDRAITRLLVPEGAGTGTDYAHAAPSGWTDLHAAKERISTAYTYSPGGRVEDGNVEVGSRRGAAGEEMVRDALETEALIARFERLSDQELVELELGPSVPDDFHGWLHAFRARSAEVDRDVRKRIVGRRDEETKTRGGIHQTYSSISVDNALGLLVPRIPGRAPAQERRTGTDPAHSALQ